MQGVIDIHTHPFTEETVKGQGLSYTEAHAFFGQSPKSPSHHWYKDRTTTPIEKSVAELKADDVDLAVVVNMNACVTWNSCLPNEYIGKYAAQNPDLYLGFAGIDPNSDRKGALAEVDRCVKDYGIVGLKFHPAYQNFFPNDRERAYPLYEKCVEYGIPVLFHTGATRMTRCTIKTCRPEFLDDVATDFPDLRIIMSHYGWPWTQEALAVIWRHQHVYMDLSGWMPTYIFAHEPGVFQYMNSVFPEKFVFGSDYPAISPKVWIEDFSKFWENGLEWGGKVRKFKEENLEKFFRTNAIEALNLKKLRPELASRTEFKILEY
ncbi:amidohydrolase family protein [Sphingobium subterraneum]|uniref:Amidohydrolase-related domain-containing protein n=1 Tax=Sphingobium subterraneum TaxID=627688 RepID=A0A841IWF3_9SPHN|nr:amidohydrolase family protein [Sphingobium subterraneum]MBB6122967.1 hypothetical protein [Sphingobium subterraneum]